MFNGIDAMQKNKAYSEDEIKNISQPTSEREFINLLQLQGLSNVSEVLIQRRLIQNCFKT